MNTRSEEQYYRVVYSTGGFFYTRARTASEYMLDPVFIQFMVLSIFLFSALMLALEVPLLAQMIFFGAGVVSTFFWMAILLVLYLMVAKALNITTIYTPALLIPMQVMNAVMMEQVLSVFGTSYTNGFNDFWDISIRTVIIILCLDILHGKFVAPQHGKFAGLVPPALSAAQSIRPTTLVSPHDAPDYALAGFNPDQSVSTKTSAVAPVSRVVDKPARPHGKASTADGARGSSQPISEPETETFKIGSETFDLTKVRFIRSEDHYLLIQQKDQSTMVRGKLRDVAAMIDVSWGVQINRSVWVAYSAIKSVGKSPTGSSLVQLKDGTVLKVSEARRVFFDHNFEQFLSRSGSSGTSISDETKTQT